MSHTRHFVLKICETIRTGIRSNYLNTRILFGVTKNPNTKYRILFGIWKIRIPNTNTTFWSKLFVAHCGDGGDCGGGGGGSGGGGTYALSPNPIAVPPASLLHRLQDSTTLKRSTSTSVGNAICN